MAAAFALSAYVTTAVGFELGLGEIGGARLVAPRVLSSEDTVRYRAIFHLQEDGRWKEADVFIDSLQDRILLGHVLYQRYMHPTRYRSSYEELRSWMEIGRASCRDSVCQYV